MIENVMHEMGGIGIYGIISISLFFAFFLGMLIWAVCLKKPYLNAMGELPLNSDTQPQTPTESNAQKYHE